MMKAHRIAAYETPEGIAAKKRYNESPKGIASRKPWNESPEGFAWLKAYASSLCEGGCIFVRKNYQCDGTSKATLMESYSNRIP